MTRYFGLGGLASIERERQWCPGAAPSAAQCPKRRRSRRPERPHRGELPPCDRMPLELPVPANSWGWESRIGRDAEELGHRSPWPAAPADA